MIFSEEFSNINEMDSGKGFSVLYLRNVCYDSESSRIVLFGNEMDKSLLFGMMKSEYVHYNTDNRASSR